ncbi:MAG: LysR family transcriptional regulator [Proteobacteria bacterium]|nr:LysR family transcriptional regulator [Pseudomonadota bacterium]
MDHLETLKAFVGVADAKGFAPAARKLQMSPPAVTRAIAALERRLGAQLLERSTRSVRLTEIGERFLGDCRRILAELDEAEASAGGAHASLRGELAVTASSMFGRLHVAPILLDFLVAYPDVSLRTFFVDRVVHMLDEGFDVAVRIARLPDSGLTAVRVGSVRRVVIASPAYLAERGTPHAPGDLAAHDAIGFSPSGGSNVPWSFPAHSSAGADRREIVQPRMRLVANASELAIEAALHGRGIARALSYQVDAEVRSGRLVIVLGDHEPEPIPVHLVYMAGRKAPAKVRALVDFAAERLRREPVLRND